MVSPTLLAPGPALDALVAEKVMNYRGGEDLSWDLSEQPFRQTVQPLPYSTDIAAAWEVVETFLQFGIAVHCCRREEWGDHRWKCIIAVPEKQRDVTAFADTAPHAICLVALKAVGAIDAP